MALDPNINRIKFLRTSTPGKAPVLNTEITEGELAINMADKTLYSANSNEVFRFGDPDRVEKSLMFANNFAKFHNVASRFIPGSAKGALVIFLPEGKYDSTTMMKFSISGYNYVSNSSWKLDLGGYNHSSTAWYNTFITYSGSKFAPFLCSSVYSDQGAFVRYDPLDPEVARQSVRFGQTTTGPKRNVVVIGKIDDMYQYPTIVIDDLITSNLGVNDQWLNGWEIGFITDQTVLDSYKYSMLGGMPFVYGDNLATAAEKFFIEELTASSNLNSVLVPGPYRCRTNAISATITNQPTGENTAFSLMVEQAAYQKQTITYYTTNNTYTRTSTGNGTGWTPWRQVAFTDSSSTGNAATATKWSTPTTFTFTGDTTGSVTFDGSESAKAIPLTTTLATSLRTLIESDLNKVTTPNSITQNGNGNQNGPVAGAFKAFNFGPEQWNTQLFSPAYQNGLWVRTRPAASAAFQPWQKLAFGDQTFLQYSTTGWYKLATVTLPINGQSATLKINGAAGFNTGRPEQSTESTLTINSTNTANILNVVLTVNDQTVAPNNIAYKSNAAADEYDIIINITGNTRLFVTSACDINASVNLMTSIGASLGTTLPTGYSVGTVRTMATVTSSIAGNAASATKLRDARTINGVSFDGTNNITIADATKLPLAGGTISGALTVNGITSVNNGLGGQSLNVLSSSATEFRGISLYGTTPVLGKPSYGITMASTNLATAGTHGAATGPWATYFTMATSNDTRGWIFQKDNTNVASISTSGVITATKFVGDIDGTISGNATTATRLQTPRNINGVAFDGTKDITIADATKLPLTGGTISGNLAVNGNVLTSQINGSAAPLAILSGTAARGINVGQLLVSNGYADVTKVPTNGGYIKGQLVVDGGISGNLTGNVTGSLTGTASTADRWTTNRSITMTGDGTWSVGVDGTANVSGVLTLANTGVVAGTHKAVTVDAKGRATAGVSYTVGLVASTAANGTTNAATNNTNTFLNVVETLGGAASSVGSSQKIQGAGTVTVASDTAGNITITGAQAITGNAGTATALQTSRTFSMTGAAIAAAQPFNGTQNVVLNVTDLKANMLTGTASVNTTGSAAKWTTPTTLNFTGAATGTVAFDGSETTKSVAMSILPATTSQVGIVKLNDTLTSTSVTEALTANQGKVLNDRTYLLEKYVNGQWYNELSSHLGNTWYTNVLDYPIKLACWMSYGGGSDPISQIELSDADGSNVKIFPTNMTLDIPPGTRYLLRNSHGGGYSHINGVMIFR